MSAARCGPPPRVSRDRLARGDDRRRSRRGPRVRCSPGVGLARLGHRRRGAATPLPPVPADPEAPRRRGAALLRPVDGDPGSAQRDRRAQERQPGLLALGFALEVAALYSYSLLTRAALGGDAEKIASWRMFRIQMSTKALSSIVPGRQRGGFRARLPADDDVRRARARRRVRARRPAASAPPSCSTSSSGRRSIVSIPIRGVNAGYATGARSPASS